MAIRRLPVLGRLNEGAIAGAVHAALGGEQSAPETVALQTFALYEQALAQVEAKIPPSRERACAVGCTYCCHLKIATVASEVLAIAAALRARLDAGQLARLRQHVADIDRRTHGMSVEARSVARIPCPLLDASGACLAYEQRPLACRGANSYSVEQCKAGFESTEEEDVPIEHYGLQRRTAAAVRAGAAAALYELGVDNRGLELVAALRIALEDPTAAARHRRGEPVFQAAVDPELTGSPT